MDQSRFVSALIGPTALAVAASLAFNQGLLADMAASIATQPALILLSGVLIMVAGLGILRGAERLGPVVLLGWLFVLGGVARIVFVRQIADLTVQMGQQPLAPMIGAAVLGVIGLFFTWQGWLVRPAAQ